MPVGGWRGRKQAKAVTAKCGRNKMKIYIASSWKNHHGVEMLTELLRAKNCEVISWVEHETEDRYREMPFDEWILTDSAVKCFEHDTYGATNCDLFIYYGPAGKDASAELGAAWGAGVPAIIGLNAKSEDLGLMRKMISHWFGRYTGVLQFVDDYMNLRKSA